jgi:hypothetical protein
MLLTDHLREHCRLNAAGFAEYDPGWSDVAILALFPEGVTANHVKDMRRIAIGELEASRKPTYSRLAELAETISTFEKRIAALESAIIAAAGYDRRIAKLEEKTGLRGDLFTTTSIPPNMTKRQ